MQKIIKKTESVGAKALQQWKRSHPNKRYADLDNETRRSLRQSLLDEQYSLCAYCTCKIHNDNSHIDHVEPKGGFHAKQNKQLDYANLVASCNRKNICGKEKRDNIIPLTPFMDSCENELVFYVTGDVEAKKDCEDAEKTLTILGLTDKKTPWLRREREAAIDALLFTHYADGEDFDKNELFLENEEILQLMKEELLQPNDQGHLEDYTPVLINILNHFLK